jgi:AraC-like DNA-binding protein
MRELALETGYYDQAHLINEFQVLTGLTPLEIAAKEQPDRNSVVLWQHFSNTSFASRQTMCHWSPG